MKSKDFLEGIIVVDNSSIHQYWDYVGRPGTLIIDMIDVTGMKFKYKYP
jgi:hypothetical protein